MNKKQIVEEKEQFSIKDDLHFAVQATRLASELTMEYFEKDFSMEAKADMTPVTIADKEIEALFRTMLAQKYPADGILGEEGKQVPSKNGRTWIIDPIDGTRAFITGHPLFGVMLALMDDGEIKLSIVTMPRLSETYCAVVGKGASLNGNAIKCSDCTKIDQAALHINEAELIRQYAPNVADKLSTFGNIRRHAHDCYSYAMLAAGKIDMVIDFDLAPYDFIPITALVESAGGVVRDWAGNKISLKSGGSIIATSTQQLMDETLNEFSKIITGEIPLNPRAL